MGEPVVAMRATAEPDALIVIRRAVSGVAIAAGLPEEQIEDVRVAVNEACTNVIVHAYPGGGGPLEVDAWIDDDRLMVCVRDQGAGIRPHVESDGAGLGLGLQLMAALSSDMKVSGTSGGGTEVRLRFDLG